MSTNLIASLRKQLPSIYGEHLPDEIRYRRADGQDVVVPLDAAYGEQARTALRDSGRDFGTVHLDDGQLRIKFELPKKVSWDQKQLAEIAERIVASGEKVEGYLDIKLSVSESRFTNWPPALQQQFAAARTVDSGKPSFTLSLDSEH